MFTKYYKHTLSTVAVLLMATSLSAAEIPFTTFDANTTAKASEVNNNFLYLQSSINNNASRLTTAESDITAAEADITNLGTSKQNRVTGTCAVGQVISAINADGSVICKADIDTDTNTVYSASSGINLVGTTFSIDTNEAQQRVSGSCGVGYSIRIINSDGSVTCEYDDVGTGDITGVTATGGLTGGGGSGSVIVKRASGEISINNMSLNRMLDNDSGKCDLQNYFYYSFFEDSSTNSSCSAAVGVNLPDDAAITGMTCRLYSNDTTSSLVPSVVLRGHYLSNNTYYDMRSISAGADSTSIQTITDSTSTIRYVNNSTMSYSLMFSAQGTTYVNTNNRFYNCTISYTY